jgi:hypothetical protein
MKQAVLTVLLAVWVALPVDAGTSRTVVQYAPPLVGARCFDPYLALGTSNIPADSSARTTVINMSAFVTRGSSGGDVPIGIVAKNYANELWLIPYQGFNAYLTHAVTSPLTGMKRERPRLITQQELTRLTSALSRSRVQVWHCFQRDLTYKPKHK